MGRVGGVGEEAVGLKGLWFSQVALSTSSLWTEVSSQLLLWCHACGPAAMTVMDSSAAMSPKLDVFFYKMPSLIMVFYHGNRKVINVRNTTYTHICNDVSQQITPLSIIFSSRQTTADEEQTINIF